MFDYKTLTLNEKKYLIKIYKNKTEAVAILHKGRYKSSVSLPEINYEDVKQNLIDLNKTDLEQLGYLTSKNSSIQLINSSLRLDASFLLENQSYVEDIDIVKSLIEAASDRNKGMIIFDDNGEIEKHLKSKSIKFDLYNKSNLKIKYADLNERILLDTLNLSNKEQSVIASFLNFKQQNIDNKELGIPVLDGSNWIYDLFIVEPSTLAQQFKVNEYSIKTLKTSMLKLTMNGIMSQEFSNINEIIKRAEDGNLIVIDIKDSDRKLVKATLANNSKEKLIVVDSNYHKIDNIQYLLHSANLFQGTTRDFKSYLVNRNSFTLKEELMPMQYYLDELKYLEFEYIAIKEKAFPIIVTNEEYTKNKAMEKLKPTVASTASFF